MENFDTNQKVKGKRESTFGNVPQAGEPQLPQKKETAPARNPQEVKQNKLAQLKQQKEQQRQRQQSESGDAPAQPQVKFVKGIQIGVTEDGFLKLLPFGDTNYLDIVAMTEYARAKKDDILAELSASKVHQVTKETSAIAKGVKQLLDAVGE